MSPLRKYRTRYLPKFKTQNPTFFPPGKILTRTNPLLPAKIKHRLSSFSQIAEQTINSNGKHSTFPHFPHTYGSTRTKLRRRTGNSAPVE